MTCYSRRCLAAPAAFTVGTRSSVISTALVSSPLSPRRLPWVLVMVMCLVAWAVLGEYRATLHWTAEGQAGHLPKDAGSSRRRSLGSLSASAALSVQRGAEE